MTDGVPITRAELQRELDRAEQRIMQTSQDRWGEHGRKHDGEQQMISEFRAEFKVAFQGFEQVLDEIRLWRAEIKGQLVVLKWFLGIVTAIIGALLITLVTKAFW